MSIMNYTIPCGSYQLKAHQLCLRFGLLVCGGENRNGKFHLPGTDSVKVISFRIVSYYEHIQNFDFLVSFITALVSLLNSSIGNIVRFQIILHIENTVTNHFHPYVKHEIMCDRLRKQY